MKRIVAALIVVIMCFMLSACSFPTYKTPLMWCVLDVLHNEPYDDGEAVDGWQYEKLNLTYKENEYYNEYCYIIAVSYTNDDGDIQFDYWYCLIATERRCIHNALDYFRDKYSDDALNPKTEIVKSWGITADESYVKALEKRKLKRYEK